MTEDRFEEFLRDGLADYNRPPEPPKDAMWSRIEAVRSELGARAGSPRRARAFPVWAQWAAGLAATLVVGIALGRLSLDHPARSDAVEPTTAAGTTREASAPVATAPGPAIDTQRTAPKVADRLASAVANRPGPRAVENGAEVAEGAARPVDAGAGGRPTSLEGSRDAAAGRAGGSSAGYRLAALRTFGQAEALLTAVRTAPDDSVDYEQLSDWARDVLASTRLLLDSPAGRDPAMARLLSDLELVLVQVAGLADDRDAGRELIQGALQQRDVLPRLRAAVPAGSTIGT